MKNISLAINFVLLALIIALFFMYSSLKKSIGGETTSSGNPTPVMSGAKIKGARIAYVNADSVDATYKLMKDMTSSFQERQNALQSEYDTKARKLQMEYSDYQQKAQTGNISQIDAQKVGADMEAKKAEIDNLQRKLEDLAREAQDKNLALKQKVKNYIADYNQKAHFDYVLYYTDAGGAVLYANDTFDITRPVVSALNKTYEDSINKAQGAKH